MLCVIAVIFLEGLGGGLCKHFTNNKTALVSVHLLKYFIHVQYLPLHFDICDIILINTNIKPIFFLMTNHV